MSLYNMLFGRNSQSGLLLAVVGLKEVDVERFRDVSSSSDGSEIHIYTRTGGGNRDDYPQEIMRSRPEWCGSEDDDYDSTYCTDTMSVPEAFRSDVVALGDILSNGLRAEFAQHIAATLGREPNEADKGRAAYEDEAAALARTDHFKANGHTFVPKNDSAMRVALGFAEKNNGELRSCLGILPLTIEIGTNGYRSPNAKDPKHRGFYRVSLDYKWMIDEDYYKHCLEEFSEEFPVSMKKFQESCERNRGKR